LQGGPIRFIGTDWPAFWIFFLGKPEMMKGVQMGPEAAPLMRILFFEKGLGTRADHRGDRSFGAGLIDEQGLRNNRMWRVLQFTRPSQNTGADIRRRHKFCDDDSHV